MGCRGLISKDTSDKMNNACKTGPECTHMLPLRVITQVHSQTCTQCPHACKRTHTHTHSQDVIKWSSSSTFYDQQHCISGSDAERRKQGCITTVMMGGGGILRPACLLYLQAPTWICIISIPECDASPYNQLESEALMLMRMGLQVMAQALVTSGLFFSCIMITKQKI